jgi:pimeloyl-ACP methyl ester carboxylesterase
MAKTKTDRKNVPSAKPEGWVDPLAPQQPLVSPTWLLKAFALAVVGAAICAYFALCLLFWQGQWQLLFHPSRTITTTPADAGLHFDDVRFDATETGKLQLAGWWIPSERGSKYSKATVLYLHDGSGSMSDTVPSLSLLHQVGINVFAFDYRGFGQSQDAHPNEQRLRQDAEATLTYLTDTRHLPLNSIFLYGKGLGASIAVDLAAQHAALPGIILDDPAAPALHQIRADSRTGILPIRLLFRDRFDLAPKLQQLKSPKLFLTDQKGKDGETSPVGAKEAAVPKTVVYLKAPLSSDPNTREAISRFLSETLY